MNCQNFETLVNDLARDQIMEASIRDRALLHSDGCESCSVRLEEERELTSRLRGLATVSRTVSGPADFEERLRLEFRKATTPPALRVNSRWRYFYAAAAAVLLAVMGLAAIRSRVVDPTTGSPEKLTAVSKGQPEIVDTRPVDKGGSIDDAPPAPLDPAPNVVKPTKPKRTPSRRSGETTLASYAAPEVTTEFLPIGYTSPVYVQEGGQVVRVELPRYAMARFGLPINMERFDERVKADVLMGADGVARAIRFVQ